MEKNLSETKKIPLPHFNPDRWKSISAVLNTFKEGTIQEYKSFEKSLLEIHNLSNQIQIKSFKNLEAFSNKFPDLIKNFFKTTLPFLANLALELPSLFPEPLDLLVQNKSYSYSFSKRQVACLIANMFFGSIEKVAQNSKMQDIINFKFFFQRQGSLQQNKLLCLFNYFFRLESKKIDFERRISYVRICKNFKTIKDWSSSAKTMGDVKVMAEGGIEDFVPNSIQVDFANAYIGGGALMDGCVQEEIRFIISPECFPSMLMFESLRDNEVAYIIGAEQFSKYKGYGFSFSFDGDFQDNEPKIDQIKRMDVNILVMDALYFYGGPYKDEQYSEECFLRELNKAYIGSLLLNIFFFKRNFLGFNGDEELLKFECKKEWIATGRWGCGAFNGLPQLKFLIQWIAASESQKNMIFYKRDDISLFYADKIVECLKNKTIKEIIGIVEEFRDQNEVKDCFKYIMKKFNVPFN